MQNYLNNQLQHCAKQPLEDVSPLKSAFKRLLNNIPIPYYGLIYLLLFSYTILGKKTFYGVV